MDSKFADGLKGIKRNMLDLLIEKPHLLPLENQYRLVIEYWNKYLPDQHASFIRDFADGKIKTESWLVARRWLIDQVPEWNKYKRLDRHEEYKDFHKKENWKNPMQGELIE